MHIFPQIQPPADFNPQRWTAIQSRVAKHWQAVNATLNAPNFADVVEAWNTTWLSPLAAETIRSVDAGNVDMGDGWTFWLRAQSLTGRSATSLVAQMLTQIAIAAAQVRYGLIVPPSLSSAILCCLVKSSGKLRPASAFFTPAGYRFSMGVVFSQVYPSGEFVFLCCVLRLDPDGTYRLVRLTEEPHTKERLRTVLELNYALYQCPVFVAHKKAAQVVTEALGPSKGSIDVRLAFSDTNTKDPTSVILESVFALVKHGMLLLPDVDGGFVPALADRKDFSLGPESRMLLRALEDYRRDAGIPEPLWAFCVAKAGLLTGGATLDANKSTEAVPDASQAPASPKDEGPAREVGAAQRTFGIFGRDFVHGLGTAWVVLPADRVTSAFPNEVKTSTPEAAIGKVVDKVVEQLPGVPAAAPNEALRKRLDDIYAGKTAVPAPNAAAPEGSAERKAAGGEPPLPLHDRSPAYLRWASWRPCVNVAPPELRMDTKDKIARREMLDSAIAQITPRIQDAADASLLAVLWAMRDISRAEHDIVTEAHAQQALPRILLAIEAANALCATRLKNLTNASQSAGGEGEAPLALQAKDLLSVPALKSFIENVERQVSAPFRETDTSSSAKTAQEEKEPAVTFVLLAEPLLGPRSYFSEMLPDVLTKGTRTGTEIRPGSDFKIKRLFIEDDAHVGQILEALARTNPGAQVSSFNYRRGIYGTIIR